jgi:arsenate reductase
MTTLFGIKNCDTIRKARRWLDDNGVAYTFHDVRSDGLDKQTLQVWEQQLGWEQLLNRRGTTWRRLPEEVREGVDRTQALQIMLDNPVIIKRPVLAVNRQLYVGFSADTYGEIFD